MKHQVANLIDLNLYQRNVYITELNVFLDCEGSLKNSTLRNGVKKGKEFKMEKVRLTG